jgi:Anti-sigma-K factor rskA
MTSDDDRIAFLAGDDNAPLDPEDRADLEALRDVLADPSVWTEPDPSLEDRIVAAITAEAAKGGGTVPLAAPPVHVGRTLPAGIDRASKARRRFIYGAISAAAAVIVAVAVTIGALTGGTSAQQYAATLSATDLVPAASGAATLTRTISGWQINFRTSGLPRRDNGRYYEAWLKNSAGTLVPIGTFNQGPEVTLWSGVSPKDFPTITVTEQEANGNPFSSGQRVLTGTAAPK